MLDAALPHGPNEITIKFYREKIIGRRHVAAARFATGVKRLTPCPTEQLNSGAGSDAASLASAFLRPARRWRSKWNRCAATASNQPHAKR
jgi:hypothetical protein